MNKQEKIIKILEDAHLQAGIRGFTQEDIERGWNVDYRIGYMDGIRQALQLIKDNHENKTM